MEATKQDGMEIAAVGQRTRVSSWRMSFIGGMGLAAFYIVWGITKMIL